MVMLVGAAVPNETTGQLTTVFDDLPRQPFSEFVLSFRGGPTAVLQASATCGDSKVKAVFSNRGATIVHWILKEFRTDSGQPLDLVPSGAGPDAVKPFTLVVDDPAITARLKDAVYRVTVNGAPNRLSCQVLCENGMEVTTPEAALQTGEAGRE